MGLFPTLEYMRISMKSSKFPHAKSGVWLLQTGFSSMGTSELDMPPCIIIGWTIEDSYFRVAIVFVKVVISILTIGIELK